MGVKLNVGITKKIGLPNYGSAGSMCNMEIELDSSMLERPDEFHRRVREIYAACRAAVEDEIQNHRTQPTQETAAVSPETVVVAHTPQVTAAPVYSAPVHNPAPVYSAPVYTAPTHHAPQGRGAPSPKQVEYVHQLARQVKLGSGQKLERLCEQMYSKPLTSLTGVETSNLIDTLREVKAGRLNLTAL